MAERRRWQKNSNYDNKEMFFLFHEVSPIVIIGVILIMVDVCLSLIPSQVVVPVAPRCTPTGNRNQKPPTSIDKQVSPTSSATKTKTSPATHFSSSLIPSQVIRSSTSRTSEQDREPSSQIHVEVESKEEEEQETSSTTTCSSSSQGIKGADHHHQARRKRRPKKKQPKKNAATTPTVSAAAMLHVDKKEDYLLLFLLPTQGNLPDLFWRAIPMEHLRQHPRFHALPSSQQQIQQQLSSLEDVRYFRQDSWQWDALHAGRCTTSQAVAALGFLEPTVGQLLGIPVSWRRGGKGAFVRLRKPALRTLEEMNAVLLGQQQQQQSKDGDESRKQNANTNTWSISNDTSISTSSEQQQSLNSTYTPFVANYNFRPTQQEVKQRRDYSKKLFSRDSNEAAMAIRMMWGNAQESTALLTALNYFCQQEPGLYLVEVGMCGAGLDVNQTTANRSSSLLIGASPDGVLHYSDGRIEALEVKNHCPFLSVPMPRKKQHRRRHKGHNNSGKKKRFFLGDREFEEKAGQYSSTVIFPHYIPQLQLEMLCLGKECRSAVMVRQTATKGALILRMQRDDEWIEEMLHFLHQFQINYVEKGVPPPTDFFWNNPDDRSEQSRYRRFVNRTQELRGQVKVVAVIPNDEIQRVQGRAPMFLD